MTAPALLFGAYVSAALAIPEVGSGDGATPVPLRLRTNRLAPEGAGGECSFDAIVLALRYQVAQTLTVRVWVDDVLVQTTGVTLPGLAAVQSRPVEVRLSTPVLVAGVERGRVRPRGAWVQVEVEGASTGALGVDGVDVEYTAMRRRG